MSPPVPPLAVSTTSTLGEIMADETKLHNPWMVAVWPGMGHVAISAGYYLMAKLGMHLFAEFSAQDLFDIEFVEVKDGLIRPGQLPRSRFFAWHDPEGRHDLVVFIGEAQPPTGKFAFCRGLMDFAEQLGVKKVFTFAAMATPMHPARDSRVFAAAIDDDTLAQLKQLDLEVLEDGQISGQNGVMLGVAAERGLSGACLLGEMPQIFAQLPFPKASRAVLDTFAKIAGIQIDFTELNAQVQEVEEKLQELLQQVELSIQQQQRQGGDDDEGPAIPPPPVEEETVTPDDRRKIEDLFEKSGKDRSQAYELKRELDRLGVYKEYEDRFLDLFTRSG